VSWRFGALVIGSVIMLRRYERIGGGYDPML
jgi:hypothetical protein